MIQNFKNPKIRRQFLLITSGVLILLALGIGKFYAAQNLRDVLMILAALIAGWDIGLRAFTSLRNKHISIELLVTIAAVGALIIGEYWEAAAVTFLFILGAYLEARTLSQTRKVLEDLLDLTLAMAVVIRDGCEEEVTPQEVLVNETALIKPGGKVPVDGEVIDGHSTVDESAITGEPMPEGKAAGSEVYAGTINQAGLLKVRATGVGADTTLARIIRRVEEAQEEKAPTQRFIERFSKWYTPFIISLSGVAYLITRDVDLALTLLVIGCPGALVISTPVSVVAGIGSAAKKGILIKGGEYLENAGKISALALDKTGTLTQGKPVVTDIISLNGYNEEQILTLAAVAEAGSEHPLARAVMNAAENFERLPTADTFDTCTGRGVRATYDGNEVGVGSKVLMSELGVKITSEVDVILTRLKSDGKTAVLVSHNDAAAGVVGVADKLREDAPKMVRSLKKAGMGKVVMLTGDDQRTASAIAKEAGIDEVYAELLPEDKLMAIRELQSEGHVVAMVGDGINDAPALAAADIGIAMGAAGTDIAIETADIALMADDLMKLPEAIKLSKATLSNIRQNVILALATVTGLLLGVIFGAVHMSGGMLIHEISVLLVILNGMRLLGK
ncbi:MAG TPA: heavy metal translocating P-type ATPase [Anaerolineaceae bacterium]|nr:heavy metal translocating P-type ATPase [Anaerolineaceae bacterium]